MSLERIRNLSPDFIRDVLPYVRHPPMPPGDFNRKAVEMGMKVMNENKEKSMRKYWPHLVDSVGIESIKIPMRDGVDVALRVYNKGTPPNDGKRVMFSMHGGGFIAGDLDSEDLINRQISTECDVVIFSIDYRLAPENKIVPTIFNDVEDGLKWTFANASKYGGDVTKGIIIRGGSMASTLAFRGSSLDIPIGGLVMRQPVFIFNTYEKIAKKEWLPKLKSREENADAPLLDGEMVVKLNKLIDMSIEDATNPYFCPIFASKDELSRMPPTYIVMAPVDPAADEVQMFADLLKDAGVPVRLNKYEGMPHGFHGHHILSAARQEMRDTAEAVHWLLEFDSGKK